ncbi:MAG: NAD(P)-dependent oxidoreductase [Tannerellaceae bacterium]|jgi:nucleoside-diphosphate-sugar epimerase|nr:NAD(P)-dependent oxidoreductase [Tannerellaceae bacterium]
MKVLITGASGFIGRHLVQEALNRGYDTWAGIRSNSSRNGLDDSRIRLINLQYEQPNALLRQLQEFADKQGPWDYVIHNAGITKSLIPANFMHINAELAKRLAQALAGSGCHPSRFALMSSLGAFGPGNPQTMAPIRAGDPQLPDSLYGKSKKEAERILNKVATFPLNIFYPTGVYGPADPDYFAEIRSIRRGLDLTAGLRPQQISFIYVKDLARAVFMAIESQISVGKRYIISDGVTRTDEEFANIIRELLNKKHLLRIRMPLAIVRLACQIAELSGKIQQKAATLNSDKYLILKARNWACDSSDILRDTGFTPAYDLRKGLEETIEWYRAQGWLR